MWPLGRMQAALRQFRIAEEMDPLAPQIRFDIGWLLTAIGRYDEAEKYCSKVLADYTARNSCIGGALLGQGKTEEAIRFSGKATNRTIAPTLDMHTRASGGGRKRNVWQRMYRQGRSNKP